jgi:hypothetical protein
MTSLYFNGKAFAVARKPAEKPGLIERLEAALMAPAAIRPTPSDCRTTHAEMVRNWH